MCGFVSKNPGEVSQQKVHMKWLDAIYIILPYCQVTRIQTEIVKCHYRKQTCNLTVFNWVDDDALVSFPARHCMGEMHFT